MSTFSSNGEVFGAKVLYGAVIALSAALLYASLTPVVPKTALHSAAATSVPQIETVVVAAKSGELPS